MKKAGVLCHGYHLHAPNWQEIVWGSPPDKLGRAPRAVLVALREKADVLVFGTGASELAFVKEGAYILAFLLNNFARLKEFTAFEEVNLREAGLKIAAISIAEVESQNTAEEVICAGRIFAERGIEEVWQVSSPFHIFRCWRDAIPHFKAAQIGLMPIFSDTGPAPKDVVILEPPHRPDRPAHLHEFVQWLVSRPLDKQKEIIEKARSF